MLDVSTEFTASTSADSLLTVSRSMKLGPVTDGTWYKAGNLTVDNRLLHQVELIYKILHGHLFNLFPRAVQT